MPRALITLLLCIAIVGTNGMILSPVLTDIAGQFSVSASVAGRAIAAYGLGTMFTALWLGRSLDSFGVARALRFALVVAGLSEAGSAFSQGWVMLVAFQFIAGMGAGIALHVHLHEADPVLLQPLFELSAMGAAAGAVQGDARLFGFHLPVRRCSASRYFSAVLSMISWGSSGPGGVLSQSRVSR